MARPPMPMEIRNTLEQHGIIKPQPFPSVDTLQRLIVRRNGSVAVSTRASGTSIARVSLTGTEYEGLADDPAAAISYALCSALRQEVPVLPGFEDVVNGLDDSDEDDVGLTASEIVALLGPDGEGMDVTIDTSGNFVNSNGDMLDDYQMKWVRLEALKVANRKARDAEKNGPLGDGNDEQLRSEPEPESEDDDTDTGDSDEA